MLPVAAPTGGLTVDGDMNSVTGSEVSLNPMTDTCLEVRYIDPSENPRVGGFAQTATSGESEKIEELPTSLLAVLNDRLVAFHARKHGDDSQPQKGGERVSLTLGPRIVNAFKEFHQRSFGIHASVLMRWSLPGDQLHIMDIREGWLY